MAKKKVKKKVKKRKVVKAQKIDVPDIRIIVAGGTAKGKSTLVQIIAEAIVKKGLNLEVRGLPGEHLSPITVEEFQEQRVMAVKGKGIKIVLEERPTYKSVLAENKIFGVRG